MLILLGFRFVLRFEFLEVLVEPVEALLPIPAILVEPIGCGFELARVELAGTPLGVAAAGDEARPFEDFEVTGDGGKADVKGLGELVDGCLAEGKPRENGATGGIGKSGEGGAEMIRHLYLTDSINNYYVKYASDSGLSNPRDR